MSTPVLCLHGALGSAASFKRIREAAGESLQLELLEFSGHGQNKNLPDTFNTPGFAGDVKEWMKSSGASKVSIFGHSLGGYVGLYLAAKHPELIERVFTFGTKMKWSPDFARNEAAMLDPAMIKEKNPKLETYLSGSHSNWEELSRRIGSYMNTLGAAPDLTPELLSLIRCPVRFGVGDSDHMVTIGETEAAYKMVPNAQMQVFPGTFHAVERLNPKYFLESVFDFLQVEGK